MPINDRAVETLTQVIEDLRRHSSSYESQAEGRGAEDFEFLMDLSGLAGSWASRLESLLPLVRQQKAWQAIETAPRDSTHILVYVPRHEPDRQSVMEAWWAIPYEAAPKEKGWWQTMGGVCLSADVHDGLGATHWMPLPALPQAVQQTDQTDDESRVDGQS